MLLQRLFNTGNLGKIRAVEVSSLGVRNKNIIKIVASEKVFKKYSTSK